MPMLSFIELCVTGQEPGFGIGRVLRTCGLRRPAMACNVACTVACGAACNAACDVPRRPAIRDALRRILHRSLWWTAERPVTLPATARDVACGVLHGAGRTGI